MKTIRYNFSEQTTESIRNSIVKKVEEFGAQNVRVEKLELFKYQLVFELNNSFSDNMLVGLGSLIGTYEALKITI